MEMTTKVAYTYKKKNKTNFRDGAGENKILDSWNRPNFDSFIQAPRGEILPGGSTGLGPGGVPVPVPKVKVIKLYDPDTLHSGGIVMSGETAELKASLNSFPDRPDK